MILKVVCSAVDLNSDFLKTLDDPTFFDNALFDPTPAFGNDNLSWAFNFHSRPQSPSLQAIDTINPSASNQAANTATPLASTSQLPQDAQTTKTAQDGAQQTSGTQTPVEGAHEAHLNLKPASSRDGYSLAAADQRDGTRDERLARVIHAKFEAGLLKPYDYVSGYRRLMHWMDSHVGTSRYLDLSKV